MVWVLSLGSLVGWVGCWFSTLLWRLPFSCLVLPLHKNHHSKFRLKHSQLRNSPRFFLAQYYLRGMGSNPVEPEFFQASLLQLLQLQSIREDHFLTWEERRSLRRYAISSIINHPIATECTLQRTRVQAYNTPLAYSWKDDPPLPYRRRFYTTNVRHLRHLPTIQHQSPHPCFLQNPLGSWRKAWGWSQSTAKRK